VTPSSSVALSARRAAGEEGRREVARALSEPEGKNRAGRRYKRPLDARAVRPRQQLGYQLL
jgi:hypothetical protein